MSPADNTPDFDSMTPEQIMAWMESLAKRQGAVEGFTTAADMQIAEIDPDTVVIDEPGYVPYGEDSKKKPAEQEKPAAADSPAPSPVVTPAAAVSPPAPPADQPVAAPAASAAPPAADAASDDAPNFDAMSPEEIMRWMESLAKRQGAVEGFTTTADMQVAEIDPTTVKIDEPGYVPYGEDTKKKTAEPAKPAEADTPSPATQPAATQPPVIPVEPPTSVETPPSLTPAANLPRTSLETLLSADEEMPTEVARKPVGEDSLAWLESLAADQGAEIPTMDLSQLASDIPGLGTSEAAADPLAWLESLAQPTEDEEQPTVAQQPVAPSAETRQPASPLDSGVDPMTWLESLARKQGVPGEELTTSADLEIPDIETVEDTGPGYHDYAFEDTSDVSAAVIANLTSSSPLDSSLADLDDPATWLDQLASGKTALGQSADQPTETEDQADVIAALNKGQEVAPEAIADWFNQQFDRAASRTDVPDFVSTEEEPLAFDPDAPAERIELPDWLLEAQGAPPPLAEDILGEPAASTPTTPPAAPALTESIAPPPDVEMPDWLLSDVQEPTNIELETIFAHSDEEDSAIIDTSDPWVEAFELERKQGQADINTVPDWYAEKLGISPTEGASSSQSTAQLQDADLAPETELPAGELDTLPDWLNVPAFDEVAPSDVEMPDWLMEQMGSGVPGDQGTSETLPDWLADIETQEVPEWLLETVTGEQEQVSLLETPVIELPPVAQPAAAKPPAPQSAAPRPAASPVPVPQYAQINAAEVLASARQKLSGGDLDGSLLDYEAIVRANTQLDVVVADLSPVMQRESKNPAIYRVLGDALMRQGRLQDALDTYRKALNLL